MTATAAPPECNNLFLTVFLKARAAYLAASGMVFPFGPFSHTDDTERLD